jgi:hypothetical protein
MMFDDYTSIGSPSHKDSPYEFKIWAIEAAWKYDNIALWCDSSLWRVGDIKKIEDLIVRDGYFMSEAGAWVGDWTNSFTRNYFKLSDHEAKVPGGLSMFSAGLLGLDKANPLAMNFFIQWKTAALAGCFKGDWKDHRHDMTCASIIAQRLDMHYQRGGQYMSYIGPGYSEPEKDTVFFLQGMN